MPDASQGEPPQVWILELSALAIPATAADAPRIFGLTSVERLERTLDRVSHAGIRRVGAESIPAEPVPGRVVVLRDDYFYDERLVQ
ncbi:MAG: hypothetical protein VCB42_04600, partial [Myxococcota bacterium]